MLYYHANKNAPIQKKNKGFLMLYPFNSQLEHILFLILCAFLVFLMILASLYCVFGPLSYAFQIKRPSFLNFAIFSFLALSISFIALVIYINFLDYYIIFLITQPKIIIPALLTITAITLIIKKRKRVNRV